MAKRLRHACGQEQARFRSILRLADQANASGHRRLAIELIACIYRALDNARAKESPAGPFDEFEADLLRFPYWRR